MVSTTLERTSPAGTSAIPAIPTTETAFETHVAALAVRPDRVRGLDRIVMLVSIAMLRWAMHRAGRHAVAHQDHALWLLNQKQREAREADALRTGLRLF